MGWPVDLFLASPDPNFLCPICQDVFEEPSTLQCGHVFCRSCLLSYQEATTPRGDRDAKGKKNLEGVSMVCPTCRHSALITESPNSILIVKSIIGNMPVRCKNQFDRDEEERELEALHDQSDSEGIFTKKKYASVECCEWKGNLSEFKAHAASTCSLEMVNCQADGCDVEHLRGYMRSGYCDKSECAVASARKYLSRKKDSRGFAIANKKSSFHRSNEDYCKKSNANSNASDTNGSESSKPWTVEKNSICDKENGNGNSFSVRGLESPKPWMCNKDSLPAKQNTSNNFSDVDGMESTKPWMSNKDYLLTKQNTSNIFSGVGGIEFQKPRMCNKDSLCGKESTSNRFSSVDGMSPKPWMTSKYPSCNKENSPINVSSANKMASPKPWKANDIQTAGFVPEVETNTHNISLESRLSMWKETCHSEKPSADGDPADSYMKDVMSMWRDGRNETKSAPKGSGNAAFVVAAVKVLLDAEVAKVRQNLFAEISLERRANNGPPIHSVKAMFVHQRLVDFCRSWLMRKPDALVDFAVYRQKLGPAHAVSQMKKLLCGIPGPKRTPYEGGLFPVLLEWDDINSPPRCKFPRDFHHFNVHYSGAVMLSTLNDDEANGGTWHPEITIPELLFDLQQLLAHPNHKAPAQPEVCDSYANGAYEYRAMIQTSLYTSKSLLEMASGIDEFGDASLWQQVDDETLTHRSPEQSSAPGPKEPQFRGRGPVECKAKCSCCAWGQTLWDSRHEMRFLFGTGGWRRSTISD